MNVSSILTLHKKSKKVSRKLRNREVDIGKLWVVYGHLMPKLDQCFMHYSNLYYVIWEDAKYPVRQTINIGVLKNISKLVRLISI